jgi:flavodoxin
MKSLILLYSYHHNNTEKIAEVFSRVLDAQVKRTGDVTPQEVSGYDLVGFGSGIYSDKHHPSMMEFVDQLPHELGKKAFIFSTAGMSSKDKTATDHSSIRDKLEAKGYSVIGEFQCPGLNTNSFLKYFGGMNKGRPNAKDLKEVEVLANKIKRM